MAKYTGKQINQYQIGEQLGEGGMAIMYKAYDMALERDVAIKFIRKDHIPAAKYEAVLVRFQREVKILAGLTHPNIVPIHDYGTYEGEPYYVLSYLPGGTLKDRIGKIKDYKEIIRLLIPLADALAYAHEHGVIHRDVKPANILFSHDGKPVLSDFGVAMIQSSEEETHLTRTGVGVGTPGYMAPEQWDGKNSPSVDQYALGVVFYELLTGRKPFQAETPMAVAIKQTNDPIPRPSQFKKDIPVSVERFLVKSLSVNPSDRYQHMHAFRRALEGILEGKSQKKFSQPIIMAGFFVVLLVFGYFVMRGITGLLNIQKEATQLVSLERTQEMLVTNENTTISTVENQNDIQTEQITPTEPTNTATLEAEVENPFCQFGDSAPVDEQAYQPFLVTLNENEFVNGQATELWISGYQGKGGVAYILQGPGTFEWSTIHGWWEKCQNSDAKEKLEWQISSLETNGNTATGEANQIICHIVENVIECEASWLKETQVSEQNDEIAVDHFDFSTIGTGIFENVFFSDGQNEYDLSIHYQVENLNLDDSPDGCMVSGLESEYLWITGRQGSILYLNGREAGVLEIDTDSHGYLFEMPIAVGDELCLTGNNPDGFSLIWGPDVLYHYDSYCFRGFCGEDEINSQSQVLEIEFEVFANLGWQDTGISLNRGDELEIFYISGEWTSQVSSGVYFGPIKNGAENSELCRPIPELDAALVGKISQGEIFVTGSAYSIQVIEDGTLFLRMNDCDEWLSDNDGSLLLNIIVTQTSD